MATNEFSRPTRKRLAGIDFTHFDFHVAAGVVTMTALIAPLDAEGNNLEQIHVPLEPYLSQAQIDQLTTFFLNLDTRARNALIEPES